MNGESTLRKVLNPLGGLGTLNGGAREWYESGSVSLVLMKFILLYLSFNRSHPSRTTQR